MIGSSQKLLMARAGVPSGGPWDIGGASYSGVSLDVSAKETSPRDAFFKPDGTEVYIIGTSSDTVHQYTLSSGWDLSTASFTRSYSVSAQESLPAGIFFKDDGTKMYILGLSGDDVNEYSLSTAWDISSASYTQNFSVSAQDTSPHGLFFSGDGTKMYFIGIGGVAVEQYALSSAWDISTASHVTSEVVSAQNTSPFGVFLRDDGTNMYVVDFSADDVNQYALSSAWDISTASYQKTFSVTNEATAPAGIFFKDDGTKMYVVCATTDSIHAYDL